MKNKTALKGGTYSIVLTTIVLAILVVVNIFAQALPSSVIQYDTSSTKLYSITSNTKVGCKCIGRGCDNLLGRTEW